MENFDFELIVKNGYVIDCLKPLKLTTPDGRSLTELESLEAMATMRLDAKGEPEFVIEECKSLNRKAHKKGLKESRNKKCEYR